MTMLDSLSSDFSKSPKEIVKDLFEPNARIFWTDFLLSAATGWGAFIAAYLMQPFSWPMLVAVLIAAIAFYRALIFIHELTHLRANALPGFIYAWNLLVGIPLLLPSFTYIGVHTDHHRLASYGTDKDPEYMPFAGKKIEITLFIAHSLLLPAVLMLRFLVLSPIGLLVPSVHRWLECHASSLTMNLAYCRQVSPKEQLQIKGVESLILGVWALSVGFASAGVLSWRIFGIWYAMMAMIMLTNTLRALAAHRYQSQGEPMTVEEQLLDSVDVPGAAWTSIWAPVGLRYHALHHYFPSMPYHNLSIAHRRLIANLPPDAPYYRSIRSSLWNSLKRLWLDDIKC